MKIGIVEQGRADKLRLYVACAEATGATVEVLPWTGDPMRDAARFDALVLCGGDDVDAKHFGERNHPTVQTVPAIRDEYEIAFVREAARLAKPLLGVCRGAQVMNVALGGSLVQHVPDLPGAGSHGDGVRHSVSIDRESILGALGGGRTSVSVNSFHHQAIGRVAPGLRVTARSADQVAESIEGGPALGPFFVGVQWHPEREGNDAPFGAGLFEALAAAAAARNP